MNHKELKARDEVKITIQTLKMKSNKCQSDRQKKTDGEGRDRAER